MLSKGDETSWWTMFERFLLEQNAQEKKKLMFGLGINNLLKMANFCYKISCFFSQTAWSNQPWILERFIQLAKNESIVRGQDFFTCLAYVSENPIGLIIDYS